MQTPGDQPLWQLRAQLDRLQKTTLEPSGLAFSPSQTPPKIEFNSIRQWFDIRRQKLQFSSSQIFQDLQNQISRHKLGYQSFIQKKQMEMKIIYASETKSLNSLNNVEKQNDHAEEVIDYVDGIHETKERMSGVYTVNNTATIQVYERIQHRMHKQEQKIYEESKKQMIKTEEAADIMEFRREQGGLVIVERGGVQVWKVYGLEFITEEVDEGLELLEGSKDVEDVIEEYNIHKNDRKFMKALVYLARNGEWGVESQREYCVREHRKGEEREEGEEEQRRKQREGENESLQTNYSAAEAEDEIKTIVYQ